MRNETLLPAGIVQQLKALPETGVGYHVVNLTMKDGTVLTHILVVDSSIAFLDIDMNPLEIAEVELAKKAKRDR